ncbi:50S ribosomal protein L11 methyltransferase [Xylella taiwanensis]|uniref:Ribosomal protein L11 methyltransferase n=1 Tax=Xylella taiwanensis TaxID=1444770 RepID=Z9JKG9_9GAMM|nr:50S ribosomal protein L11 methyltransferase [Xylella taiwanensis]AXI83720.1 ribosomal protein L11 methyltransferase [Xylella taiwanensis]EWS78252.1 ribosomal protein L11 methyltransferase [Xylella taiwanensis]MCD8456823.1 50S ribosomal protein L11 methyltransferase [Xylella taiwanensis]MCD8459232.1 50S ribosomal protein L11 methyltransferase [Xylella taiwanensis]MCD8461895.1 50S ribosomal protein L11 methyltransferase [Xylella taiwanensis]
MPFLELTLHCTDTTQPRYEQVLETCGALAITLLDADANTGHERGIFEPGVGETVLWDALVLSALFPVETNALGLLGTLQKFDPELEWAGIRFGVVEDQDWERVCLDQFRAMRFGARTFIVPWNKAVPEEASGIDAAVVRLDPGLAFGSGTHPTTGLCLRWLDTLGGQGLLTGRQMLDFGCGSGILAMAGLKLGAAGAVGVDNDPQALLASTENARRNGVVERLAVYLPSQAPARTYPVVVANILAATLVSLSERLSAYVAPGGHLALSGILHGEEAEVLRCYAAWFDLLRCEREEDWIRIEGVRRC